jgi:pyridoxine/pyridoxamine 5'-phosphate oxidase
MTREFIYDQIRQFRLAVLATTSGDHQPEAAVVGIAINSGLEVVFDTVRASRKYRNLIAQPKVALVIGWKNETTIQFEGDVTELGPADDAYRETYYAVFPEGRERTATWEGLTHFVIRPRWIRYSNFNEPVQIEELRF